MPITKDNLTAALTDLVLQAVKPLLVTVAQKADLAGLVSKNDISQLATKADITALAAKIVSGTITPPTTTVTKGVYINSLSSPETDIASAASAYNPGDTIYITKDTDNQGAAFTKGSVNVVGVLKPDGSRPKMTWSAGTAQRLPWGKGIFDFESGNLVVDIVVKNLELSGAVLDPGQGGNGAAVRIPDGANSFTIDNCYVHDCNNGILGAAKTTTITNSKFERNGAGPGQDGRTHNIYLSAFCDNAVINDCFFGAVNMGNITKSRAKATTYSRCVFDSTGADGSYLIDLPNGGNVVVQNCVLNKSTGQSQRYILSYGVEGLPVDGRVNVYEFKQNIVLAEEFAHFINAAPGSTCNFHDNKIVGNIDALVGTNQVFVDRVTAGLPANGLPALP